VYKKFFGVVNLKVEEENYNNKQVFNKFKSRFQNYIEDKEWEKHFKDWLKFKSLREKAVVDKAGEKPGIKTASDYFYEALNQTKDLKGYNKSIKLCTKAIELDPKDEMSYIGRGAYHVELSKLENKLEKRNCYLFGQIF
jgi:tetratricopeptide (TPR) repeat protein